MLECNPERWTYSTSFFAAFIQRAHFQRFEHLVANVSLKTLKDQIKITKQMETVTENTSKFPEPTSWLSNRLKKNQLREHARNHSAKIKRKSIADLQYHAKAR